MKSIFYISIVLLLFACKKEVNTKTYISDLEIKTTSTPATATAGQDIISRVYFEIPSVSGSIFFQPFKVKEIAPRIFNINAKALYKNWNSQFSLPVFSTFDTTLFIKTTVQGKYILNFYNSTLLLKSDTVQVN